MRPLHGVRVLELATVVSGPWAGMLLADLGADVVKLEPPAGDVSRAFGPHHRGVSAYFWNVNRGKRSAVVDLRTAEGRGTARALVERCDVVLENWRPGVAERLGLGAEELRARLPRLVTVSVRGYGEEGPYAGDRVYDSIIQAVSGMAAGQGGPDRPELIRTILPDKLAALAAVQGVLAALLQRERTGRGAHVAVSMLDAAVAFLWPDMMLGDTFVERPRPPGPRAVHRPSAVVRAGDGRWLAYTAVDDAQWAALCQLLGRAEWVARYPTFGDRAVHGAEIAAEVERRFAGRGRDEVLADLRRVGVPCGPVNTLDEVGDDPQVRANGVVRERVAQGVGRVREPGPLVRVGDERWVPPPPPPDLGQHTSEVLAELDLGGELG